MIDPINTTTHDGRVCEQCGEDAVVAVQLQGSWYDAALCGACADQVITCGKCEQRLMDWDGVRVFSTPDKFCWRCAEAMWKAIDKARVDTVDEVRR